MKKIVGILSAAAVLATSVFALDISAMIQLDGNLATIADGKFNAIELNEWDPQGSSDFVWKFNADAGQAGATVFSYAPGDKHWVVNDNQNVQEWNLWFKPIDTLKVTVGYIGYDYGVKPHFGWWAAVINREDYGFAADLDLGALKLSAGIGAAYTGLWGSRAYNTYWFDKDYEGLRKLGAFWLGGAYTIDGVGTIGGSINRGAKVNPHGFAQTQQWGATPFAIDAYFANQPWGQTGYFADLALVFAEKGTVNKYDWNLKNETGDEPYDLVLDRVTGQLYFEFHADAFTLYVVDVLELRLLDEVYYSGEDTGWAHNGKVEGLKKFKDGFELKAQYALDTVTPYVQIDGYGIMDKSLGIKVAATCNVGTCSIDVGANFALGFADDFTAEVTLPIEFTVNF